MILGVARIEHGGDLGGGDVAGVAGGLLKGGKLLSPGLDLAVDRADARPADEERDEEHEAHGHEGANQLAAYG